MLMLSTFILQNIIFDDKSSRISLENQKSLQDNSHIEQTHLFFFFVLFFLISGITHYN